jgi:type III pantothenate kinase
MLLAIDTGNTETVFAVFADDDALIGEWRISTKPQRTADEYAVWLDHLMTLKDIDRRNFNAAIISTVVPATLFNLRGLCRQYFSIDPMIVGAETVNLGMRVLIDTPAEVGADRLVNAVAAHAGYGGPLIVIDFGTATTFDVVDAGGNYRGGVIAPGVNLSLEALHMAAARLPRVAISRPDKVIGTNTVGAIQSGIYWGYVSMIEGVIARIRTEYGSPLRVIATGGLAALFEGACDSFDAVDADLTLTGLRLIHRMNRGFAS